jgi:cell division protease FtsH
MAEPDHTEQPHGPGWRVEGAPPRQDQSQSRSGWYSRLPGGRWFLLILLAALAVNWLVSDALLGGPPARIQVPYTQFLQELDKGNVASVISTAEAIQGSFKTAVVDPTDAQHTSTEFQTQRPAFAGDDLLSRLIAEQVVVNANSPDKTTPWWQTLLFGFGPTLLLLWLFWSFFRRAGAGLSGIGGLGRSQARLYQPTGRRTTFNDVAGIDEAEAELVEVVDFLKHPDKYTRLGGQIPRGVLLSGPPGTGKTLLARAVAGEAGVPFFSMAASEFIEMIVGVGASRVRDLFRQAKEAAPAIIFIDEIDSIGRARGGAMSFGGHDEREQTLNQILAEMDGFTGTEGVVVIAATNRAEILDPALLRPGRFDRHVVVNSPDRVGREAILAVHTHRVPLGDDVDLGRVAAATPGMVGADLANLVNEAALTAARVGHDRVMMADFTNAQEKIVLGAARKIMLSPDDRRRTAYHESGHALLGMLSGDADRVRKVSIIPRGRALGVTMQAPDADRYAYSEQYLLARIQGALGGRAAEELVFGTTTTGAESDLAQVTQIARNMVGRWGMSDAVGPLAVLPDPELALTPFGADESSPATRELVDREVHRIVEECYQEARRVLADHRPQLDALATALLEQETLDETAAYAVAGLTPPVDSA